MEKQQKGQQVDMLRESREAFAFGKDDSPEKSPLRRTFSETDADDFQVSRIRKSPTKDAQTQWQEPPVVQQEQGSPEKRGEADENWQTTYSLSFKKYMKVEADKKRSRKKNDLFYVPLSTD